MGNKEVEVKYLLRENGTSYVTSNLSVIAQSLDLLVNRVSKEGAHYEQGYLSVDDGWAINDYLGMQVFFEPAEARLRRITKPEKTTREFTFKGDGTLERDEETCYPVKELFDQFWPLTLGRRVEKMRLKLPYGEHTAEIDFYLNRPDLVVAEVEIKGLSPEEAKAIALHLPPLGKDITNDKAYKNKNLAR